MTEFTLDTSGEVANVGGYRPPHSTPTPLCLVWNDLDDFTQGYVQAALEEAGRVLGKPCGAPPSFRRLAPETLAAILKDCADFQNYTSGLGFKTGKVEGARFWRGRLSGLLTGAWAAAFPPLEPYLGDDGKVFLREAAR